MAKDLSAPGLQLTWEPTTAEFVGNGTVGYMIGCSRFISLAMMANFT